MKLAKNIKKGFLRKNVFVQCNILSNTYHYLKSVRIWSYSGPHFPAFVLNTETESLGIQSKCEKIGIRITPNRDTFHAMYVI